MAPSGATVSTGLKTGPDPLFGRTDLAVPIAEKDQAKALGARWDGAATKMVCPDRDCGGAVCPLAPLGRQRTDRWEDEWRRVSVDLHREREAASLDARAEISERICQHWIDRTRNAPIIEGIKPRTATFPKKPE